MFELRTLPHSPSPEGYGYGGGGGEWRRWRRAEAAEARRQAALDSAGPVEGEEGGPVVSVDCGSKNQVASGGGQLWRRVEAAVAGGSDGRRRATGGCGDGR